MKSLVRQDVGGHNSSTHMSWPSWTRAARSESEDMAKEWVWIFIFPPGTCAGGRIKTESEERGNAGRPHIRGDIQSGFLPRQMQRSSAEHSRDEAEALISPDQTEDPSQKVTNAGVPRREGNLIGRKSTKWGRINWL